MKTEHQFAEVLRQLMTEVPLDSISVSALSDRCNVSRKTFYYHFHDLYDLLTLVFLDEKIDDINKCKNITSMLKTIYNYFEKNQKFVDATLNSAGKDLLQEFIYNNCYQCMLRFVNTSTNGKTLHINDKKSIARFYALAYSNSIIYYLSSYKNRTHEGLMRCFGFLDDDVIEKSVNQILEKREK